MGVDGQVGAEEMVQRISESPPPRELRYSHALSRLDGEVKAATADEGALTMSGSHVNNSTRGRACS